MKKNALRKGGHASGILAAGFAITYQAQEITPEELKHLDREEHTHMPVIGPQPIRALQELENLRLGLKHK